MNQRERFLFDLNGYLVLEDVLTAEEIRACNEAIDRNPEHVVEKPSLVEGTGALSGSGVRGDIVDVLTWPQPWCRPFRDLLAHPRVVPYLVELLRDGFRLDHLYGILMNKGSEGLQLHHDGTMDDLLSFYQFHAGRMRCGLTVVSWNLTDCGPGDGGFMCIPGSHKSNYPVPDDVRVLEADAGIVKQIEAKAGSVIIFTEGLVHGTMPWSAEHQRRAILYKYSPAPMSWDRQHLPQGTEGILDELSPEQRSVLEPPYSSYLKRPGLAG